MVLYNTHMSTFFKKKSVDHILLVLLQNMKTFLMSKLLLS